MSYNSFARFYDGLMEDAEYKKRCDYIIELANRHNHDLGRTLDLACGTGSLTRELKKSGVDVFGADMSIDMLTEAMQKNSENGLDIFYINQSMQELDLGEEIDTCVCTLDSLNHIVDIDELQEAFCAVAGHLSENGMFIFDVNTVYKHQEVLGDNAFVFENDSVFCAWQNELDEDNIVNIYLDFFEENNGVYERFSESFCERAYSDSELRELIDNAGLTVVGVYDDLSFDSPREKSERVIYAVTKNLKK